MSRAIQSIVEQVASVDGINRLAESAIPDELEAVKRLTRDLAKAAEKMTIEECRFLVRCYYTMQNHRMAMAAQLRELSKEKAPHDVFVWLSDQQSTLETQIKRALDRWSSHDPLAQWAKSIIGIGPVISSGLRAHIDFNRVTSYGQIWSYAGLIHGISPVREGHDPMRTWEKGEKRPWNAELKTLLAFKLGESFVKVSGNENSYYGARYVAEKDKAIKRNEQGYYKENAELKLARFRIGKDTDAYAAYSQGLLPKAHIHAIARRATVKHFVTHYFEAGYHLVLDKKPPTPWIIEHGGHVDYVSWREVG